MTGRQTAGAGGSTAGAVLIALALRALGVDVDALPAEALLGIAGAFAAAGAAVAEHGLIPLIRRLLFGRR